MGLNGCYTQYETIVGESFYERPISGCDLLACSSDI